MKSHVAKLALLMTTAGLSCTGIAQSWTSPDMYVAAMVDTAYVTEGRDNLGRGGMMSYEVGADFGNGLSTAVWTANDLSDQVDYTEINGGLEYAFNISSLEAYVGYTYLGFNDGSSDNELGFGIATTELPLTLGFDYRRSSDADGGFVELSGRKEFVSSNGISITPYLMYALDYGYASEAHDGHNHTQIGVDLSKEIMPDVELFGYYATAFSGQDVENDGLKDETWGGIGINLSF